MTATGHKTVAIIFTLLSKHAKIELVQRVLQSVKPCDSLQKQKFFPSLYTRERCLMNIDKKEARKLQWKYTQWLIYFIFAFLAAAVAITLVLQPATLRRYIADADTAALLLQGYADWYKLLEKIFLFSSVLTAVFGLSALVFYAATFHNPKYQACRLRFKKKGIPITELGLVLVLGLFCCFVLSAITADINPREKYQRCLEDIIAIEERDLLSVDVYLNKNYASAGLADHGQGCPMPLTAYSARPVSPSGETPSSWFSVYVVSGHFDFTPNQEHFYNENRNTDWNAENAAVYRVTYTPNCHLVTSIVELLR